jgi:hypothetical protein
MPFRRVLTCESLHSREFLTCSNSWPVAKRLSTTFEFEAKATGEIEATVFWF